MGELQQTIIVERLPRWDIALQAFKGLLASDGGMLGILLGASPVMCLGVWQMIHTPCRTMSFSVCCWSCNNEYDIVLLVM